MPDPALRHFFSTIGDSKNSSKDWYDCRSLTACSSNEHMWTLRPIYRTRRLGDIQMLHGLMMQMPLLIVADRARGPAPW